jgi:hypothetical protein
VTVAVAVVLEVPFATIEDDPSWTDTLVAGPGVWVRVAVPSNVAAGSVAVTVTGPAVVELVIVAV